LAISVSLYQDGETIAGHWEICHDGKTWEHNFDLTYTKSVTTEEPPK
jgi:hypothetical protein